MEDLTPEVQEKEPVDTETPDEPVEAEPVVEPTPEPEPNPEPVAEPTPNAIPVDAVAQALEEAAKPPVTLEILRNRQNLLYKEIKRYLQMRNDFHQLEALAEAFAGEGI